LLRSICRVNTATCLTAAQGDAGANLNLIPNKNLGKPGWNEQQESEYEIGKSSAEGGHAVHNQHRFAESSVQLPSHKTTHHKLATKLTKMSSS